MGVTFKNWIWLAKSFMHLNSPTTSNFFSRDYVHNVCNSGGADIIIAYG